MSEAKQEDAKRKVTREEITKVLLEAYGLAPEADSFKDYPSYDDQNIAFRSSPTGEMYMMKISNLTLNGQSFAVLETQNRALLHLEAKNVRCSRVIPSILPAPAPGEAADPARPFSRYSVWIPGVEGRLARVLGFVPGKLFASTRPQAPSLFRSLGEYLATLDQALESFEDSTCKPRESEWEMAHCGKVVGERVGEMPAEKQGAITRTLEYYTKEVEPRLRDLPSAFIHADANDFNIIVSEDGTRVEAVIDFGDFTRSRRAYDLAICIGYLMMDREQPVDVAADIVEAYQRVYPLTRAELGVVFPLGVMRACVSICMSNHSYRLDPSNDYLLVTSRPGWNLVNTVDTALGGIAAAHAAFLGELERRGVLGA